MISERVFLAFDTGRSLAYVQAAGWERAYLLWTFRKFTVVPHKILNERQRKLVEVLYGTASTQVPPELGEECMIGTVEDFQPPSPAQCSTNPSPEEMGANGSAKNRADVSPNGQGWPVVALHAMRVAPGRRRSVGFAAALAIIVALGWQMVRIRPIVSASAPNPTPVPQTRLENLAGAEPAIEGGAVRVALPVHPDAPAIAPKGTPLPVAAKEAHRVQRDALQVSSRRVQQTVAEPSGAANVSAAMPRLPISGPPRKLVYPDCPDGARGKVSLQAVVSHDGKVSQVTVLTGNRMLGAAAARAVRAWRYQPFSGSAQEPEREARITVAFISGDVVAVSFPEPTRASE